MFSEVQRGGRTMQSLVDWVRSVEPPDPAPVTKNDTVDMKGQVGGGLFELEEVTEMLTERRD
jgi:hypothetical protein